MREFFDKYSLSRSLLTFNESLYNSLLFHQLYNAAVNFNHVRLQPRRYRISNNNTHIYHWRLVLLIIRITSRYYGQVVA